MTAVAMDMVMNGVRSLHGNPGPEDRSSARLNGKATHTTARAHTSPPHTTTAASQRDQPLLDIIDIRQNAIEFDLGRDVMSMLKPDKGPKKLPTLLLYDEKGLQTFEEITYLDEYYLTNAEIDVLTRSADEIAQNIQSGSMVIELGSGNLRKVSILLRALDAAGKSIHYYALDLSQRELERTLSSVPTFKHIVCHGLLGTYDDGLEWIRTGCNASWPKCILSLGSSIGDYCARFHTVSHADLQGNFERGDASRFLKDFADLLRPSDSMLIAVDACDDPGKVYHAYNDCQGVTHRFVLNGLENANRILHEDIFHLDDWKVIGEYVYDKDGGRHQAFVVPKKDVTVRGVYIEKGERVHIEQSLKYSETESQTLWAAAGLKEVGKWKATKDQYNIHMLTKVDKPFQLHPSQYAVSTVPTLADWRGLWATWDTVTRGMIPNNELLAKPIKLRNACIFYLGHIPTFLDMQICKATNSPLCEPSYFSTIFERGIDPDVDNPDHCHAHSEIPDQWPPVEEILDYQAQVRRKVEQVYASGTPTTSRKIGRSLWIGFEHEIMHLETLLYMLLQSDNRMAPPRTVRPDFENDARLAAQDAVPNEWFTIPEQTITIGLEDPEDNSGPDHHFGWDNEKPAREKRVQSFKAQGRPITNEEYAIYLAATGNKTLPASWTQNCPNGNSTSEAPNNYVNGHANGDSQIKTHTNGQLSGRKNTNINGSIKLNSSCTDGKLVRTVYGLVPLKHALHWPVFASFNELTECAAWMGGRIPTADEVRSIYNYADILKSKDVENQLGKTVPAVNGHLVNDGVEESPPSQHAVNGGGSQELFANLEDANVGFRRWHPVAVAANGNKLAGQGELGGVWEWTSSVLEKHEGFQPMPLYPAYTADFFDGKHNVVLGGSWATHPRISGRKTFVNWYQRNYPYAWVGARLVRDI